MRPSKHVDYLRKPQKPGFGLAAQRVFQVLVALLQHAIEHAIESAESQERPWKSDLSSDAAANAKHATASSASPSKLKTKPSFQAKRTRQHTSGTTDGRHRPSRELGGVWTVEEVAAACGCNRNTAGAALKELVALGWIIKGVGRASDGEYSGFWYCLVSPPSEPTSTAQHFYTYKVDQTEDRVQQLRQRIEKSLVGHGEVGGGSRDSSATSAPPLPAESSDDEEGL